METLFSALMSLRQERLCAGRSRLESSDRPDVTRRRTSCGEPAQWWPE